MDINKIICSLDASLAYYNGKPNLKELQEYFSKDGIEVKQPYEHDLMFDLDYGDYILTIHYYDAPQNIPPKAINLGKTYYMYPNVEVFAPTYWGMCDIVEVFNHDCTTTYAFIKDNVVYL